MTSRKVMKRKLSELSEGESSKRLRTPSPPPQHGQAHASHPREFERVSDGDPDFFDFDPYDHFMLESTSMKKWKQGAVLQKSYKIKMTAEIPTDCPTTRQLSLNRVMEAALSSMLDDAPAKSTAQIFIVNPYLNTKAISTQRTSPRKLTFEHLAERLSRAIQSDDKIKLSETEFCLSLYSNTVGGRGPSLKNRQDYNLDVWARSKSCLWDPIPPSAKKFRDTEDLCVPLILSKELYLLENPKLTRFEARHYQKSRQYRDRAHEIVRDAGLLLEDAPFSLEQLPLFIKAVPPGVALNFYNDAAPPIIQIGPPGEQSINIFLKYVASDEEGPTFHAMGITSMAAFMGTKKFCHQCFKGYEPRWGKRHNCPKAGCKYCKYVECENRQFTSSATLRYTCEDCDLPFKTTECYIAHIPTCGNALKCKLCGVRYTKSEFNDHPCGTTDCRQCRIRHSPLESCYVQTDKKKPKKNVSIWYADTETQVDPVTQDHNVNLIVLQHQNGCKPYVYTGERAMVQFVKECMRKGTPFKDSYIVFHNAAGFDAHFWYKELLKAKTPPKSIIRKGQKIISMELAQNGIICRDSLQFLPGTPLAAFPSMFNLESGPKGDFPHGLNTPQWIQWGRKKVYREVVNGVEHRFPPIKYFWPENRRSKQLATLKKWHAEMVEAYEKDTTLVYCPETELLNYCKQDVRILREGFETYRRTWMEQYPGLEPLQSLTFPAYNNKIFRDVYMPKDSVSILPPLGYDRENQKYSVSAMAWIAWMERQLNLSNVRTARKGGEVNISGYHVDGTGVDDQGRLYILQFHGCYFHGHHCKTKRTVYLDDCHERTVIIDKHLQQLGQNPASPYGPFIYHRIYECAFWAQAEHDATMKDFVQDYMSKFTKEPLRPREAVRGGRTEVVKHRIIPVPPEYTLYYVDFTSLYPAVNYGVNGEMWPIGQPDIYIGKDLEMAPQDPKEWFGLVKVVVEPPASLLHPVLGQSIGEKLLFHLCTTCAHQLNGGPCPHTARDREISGTFFTGELQLALEKGYKLVRVEELWHWPKERQSSELFRGLIRDQYAKKALASSVPADPVEFERLLDEYAQLGLELKAEDFRENSALRALAKFSLNNIWGFLGKRNDVEETKFVKTLGEYLEIENDPNYEITRTIITDDDETLLLTYKPLKEEPSRTGNVVLAALTTAYARMALYNVIDQYQEQTVYMDTDSLFLLLPPGMDAPPTSTVLGGLKDEIHEDFGSGASISQFASIGPKSYTYTVQRDGVVLKEVVKMKGISFTDEAANIVTPGAMRNLQLDGDKRIYVPQRVIRKDIFKTRLWNAEMTKQVRCFSMKRWFLPGPNSIQDTRPHGYK